MNDGATSKLKRLSLAAISGFIGEYIEDGITRFLHDFTNTEYLEADLSSGIFASIITNVGLEFMKNKDNIIRSSFLGTGLTFVFIAIYDEVVNNEEIDYDALVPEFLYDTFFITLIMYFYNKLLEYIKRYKKKDYDGAIYYIVKDTILNLPITFYFAYRAFMDNINESRDRIKEKTKKDNMGKEN